MASLSYRTHFIWDHRFVARRASAYLDGELRAGGKLRVERHVVECEECRRLLAGLRATLDALAHLPAASGDPQRTAAAVRQRLDEPGAR